MEFEHSFTIPVPPDKAWDLLLDVVRVAPCMPGATVESFDGEKITGHVRVKVGPITMTYAGQARFVDLDPVAHTTTLEASGKESRGTGTATAVVHAALHGENGQAGGQTRVTMSTTLNVTGRPAQMGRGVLADISGKLVERFAANLAEQLSADSAQSAAGDAAAGSADAGGATAPSAPAAPEDAAGGAEKEEAADNDRPAQPRTATTPRAAPARKKEDETLDLLGVAAGPVLRRALPVIGALTAATVVVVLAWLRRKRRNTP